MMPATQQYVVVELRVDASQSVSESARYSAALDKAQKAADALAGSADKAQKAITSQGSAMAQTKAANDNLATSYKAANDNAEQFGKGIVSHAADFLNNVNHLKLMALAAYAMSPAFRSFTNTEVSAGLRLIGVNMGLVSAAAQSVVAFASPALSFFARMAIPIGIAVAAWAGLNYVINLGSDILKKYTDAERSLFASDVNENLTKLTKFQTDTISLQQVAYATDLAARLKEAKQTISDFLGIQIDLTAPALKLQAAWVSIIETIAKGVDLLNNVSGIAQSIGNLPIWNLLNFNWHLPGALTPSQVIQPSVMQDNSAALAIARQRLAAGMGSTDTFANRFSNAISALSKKPDEPDKYSTNSYDRARQGIKDQIDLLQIEAAGAGKTSQAYQELKVEHTLTIAAMRAGIPITQKMRDEWIADADKIAAATIALNRFNVEQSERFKGATMFMSPSDVAAANAAHQIDPNNWVAHLNEAGPQMAAFNQELKPANVPANENNVTPERPVGSETETENERGFSRKAA